VGISSTTVSTNFIFRVREILATELSFQEGKIPTAESSSHSLPSGKNSINGAAKPGVWEGKSLQQSPISEGDKSHSGVSWSGVSWSDVEEHVLPSLSGRSHLGMSIGSN